MGRLGAGSRPWKARDVLSQNLDENNNIQTGTDRCTTSSTVNSSVWYWCVCVCVLHTVCWGHERIYMLYSYVEANSVLLLVADDDTTSTVSPTKERRPRKDTRHAGPPANSKCGCFGSAS